MPVINGKPEVTRLFPQQCQAQVIALWHADTESMLVTQSSISRE